MTTDCTTFVRCDDATEPELRPDPFMGLRYHFGMLLGVADFEAQQAYHLGKMRLHNAWLHGFGVVWGMGVTYERDTREIKVSIGLALDPAGHELHLDADACVDPVAWFEKHKDDAAVQRALLRAAADANRRLQVRVLAHFRPCLMREVPALSEPCEGSNTDTAFSRVFETVRLELAPVDPLVDDDLPMPAPFERVRILLGLQAPRRKADGTILPEHQDVLDLRRRFSELPITQRLAARTVAFNHVAALDAMDLRPAKGPDEDTHRFPALDRAPIVLATITLEFAPDRNNNGWRLFQLPIISLDERATLMPTAALQRLLSSLPPARVDAGGPRFSMQPPAGNALTLVSDKPLSDETITDDAFDVSSRADGDAAWKVHDVTPAIDQDHKTVTLTLAAGDAFGAIVRVIARGTGPTPIVGADGIPLAGGAGDPPATTVDGRDFVAMRGA